MTASPTMQLLGWAANRAAEAVVNRVTDHAARAVKARLAAGARKVASEKRQLLSKRGRA